MLCRIIQDMLVLLVSFFNSVQIFILLDFLVSLIKLIVKCYKFQWHSLNIHRSEAAKPRGASQLMTCGTKDWMVLILLSTSRFSLLKGNSCPKQGGFKPSGAWSWSAVEEGRVGVSHAPLGAWSWDRQGPHHHGAVSAWFPTPAGRSPVCSRASCCLQLNGWSCPPLPWPRGVVAPQYNVCWASQNQWQPGSCRAPAAIPSTFSIQSGWKCYSKYVTTAMLFCAESYLANFNRIWA